MYPSVVACFNTRLFCVLVYACDRRHMIWHATDSWWYRSFCAARSGPVNKDCKDWQSVVDLRR